MHIILGGTGHVGSALATRLLAMHEPVTIVSHNGDTMSEWESKGARVAIADVNDPAALRDVLASGTRLFLLNPPAAPDTDTDAVERRSVASILEALDGLTPERVVVHSTYGAQRGEACGDLNILYALEQGVVDKPYDVHVQRAAYYYSNWDMALEEATKTGAITSFYPADFELPMVAPADLGESASVFLASDACAPGLHHVEGPRRYTPQDVADAIGASLGKSVTVNVIPESDWENAYRKAGFSPAGAHSYARMTAATLHSGARPVDPRRGSTELADYFREKSPS